MPFRDAFGSVATGNTDFTYQKTFMFLSFLSLTIYAMSAQLTRRWFSKGRRAIWFNRASRSIFASFGIGVLRLESGKTS